MQTRNRSNHISPARLVLLIVTIVLSVALPTVRAEEETQDSYVLATFQQYQQIFFVSEVAYPCDIQLITYRGPRAIGLAFEKLDNAKAWLLGGGSDEELTDEQAARLKEWIEDGGILLLAAREGSKFFPVKTDIEWTGQTDWRPERTGITEKLNVVKHPLTKGLVKERDPLGDIDDLMADDFSLSGPPIPELVASSQWALKDRGKGQVLISNKEAPLLWLHKVGKGHIVYLGADFTPINSKPEVKQNHIFHEMSRPGILLWKNLISHFNLPTRSEQIEAWAKESNNDAALWYRYQTELTAGGAMAFPSHPVSDDEVIDEMALDLVPGEADWRQVFFTTAKPRKALSITLTDWNGPATAGDGIQFFWQRPFATLHPDMVEQKPLPDYDKAPFHVIPATELPPMRRNAVDLPGQATHTFWLRIDVPRKAAAGEYTGTVNLVEAGKTVASFKLKTRIRSFDGPYANNLHFEYEHNWNTMPGGSVFPKKDKPALVAQAIRDTASMNINTGMVYGYVQQVYGAQHVKFLDTGEPIVDHLRYRTEEIFSQDKLPSLDFSYYGDFYFTPAILAGQNRFQTNASLMPGFFLSIAKNIDPDATVDSEIYKRIFIWYHSEFVKYIKERGYTHVWCKSGDELDGAEALHLLPAMDALKKAGYNPMTTSASFQFTKDVAPQLNPDMDLWMGRLLVKPWKELAKEHVGMDIGDDHYWPYGASSWPGFTVDSGRRMGWAAAYTRHIGFHMHHYFRYYWNDTQPAVAGPNGLYQGTSAISYAQGIKYGRALSLLLRMLDEAEKDPAKQETAKAVRDELAKIISPNEDALLKVEYNEDILSIKQNVPGVQLINPYAFAAPPRVHDRAKSGVYDLIEKLNAAHKGVVRTVSHGDIKLVDRGVLQVTYAGDVSPEKLNKHLSRYVPLTESRSGGTVRVICGTKQDEAVKQFLEANNLQSRVNDRYPAEGHYAIHINNSKDNPEILIVGGSEAGVQQGMDCLIQMFEVEVGW